MHTGDLATMDENDYINIVGRSKDMIIRGGENIYPREIEEFLYTPPAIEDEQVVGVPDARYREEIAAFVISRDGETIHAERLREFCRGRIAHYEIPRYMVARRIQSPSPARSRNSSCVTGRSRGSTSSTRSSKRHRGRK